MEGLNAKDIEILRFYAENDNRELYFNYLAHKAGNDGYPLLALGVVRNDNAPGATANVFADNQARADGVAMGERGWHGFGVDLMQADFALRFKHFEAGRPDLALNLPARDVQDSHDPIFRQYDINPDGWTPRRLLEAARRHGGDEEAEKVWAMLRDNSMKGVSRAGGCIGRPAAGGSGVAQRGYRQRPGGEPGICGAGRCGQPCPSSCRDGDRIGRANATGAVPAAIAGVGTAACAGAGNRKGGAGDPG